MSQSEQKRLCAVETCGRPCANRANPLCQTHARHMREYGSIRPIRPYGQDKPADGICTFEGCDRPWAGHKWCRAHADQYARGEDLRPLRVRGNKGLCQGPGCEQPATDFDLCGSHAYQQRKGRELTPIKPKTRYNLPRKQAYVRDAEGRKQCLECKEWLPTDEFQKRSQAKDGLQSRCNECLAIARAPWTSKDAVLRRQYGIGEREYGEIFQSQGGACAGCKRTSEELGVPYLHVDHDHSCCPGKGKSEGCCVRGLLCSACNGALGLVADNISTMKNLIAYLEKPTL